MKILITIFLTTFTLTVFSQQTDNLELPSNSFENAYRKSNPTLTYSYDSISQIHNYSNNWDFDKDGIKDELYFVGTGGAHLYYFLKVILSTDKISREFNFIQSDFPFLTANDIVDIEKKVIGFVVAVIGENKTPTIIVRLDDQSYYANDRILTDKKIKTRNIAISFENGKTKYGSL
jgi:rRNA processing protein Gar1